VRETVYIAGPFRADAPEGVALNIARAESLAVLAAREGLAPVVIHSMGVAVFGPDEDPETHERAIQTGEALAAQCDHIWIIRPEGVVCDLTEGCEREWWAWLHGHDDDSGSYSLFGHWGDWVKRGAGGTGPSGSFCEHGYPPIRYCQACVS